MRKRLLLLFNSLLFAALLLGSTWHFLSPAAATFSGVATSPTEQNKQVLSATISQPDTDEVRFILHLREKVDRQAVAEIEPVDVRRAQLVEQLQQTAVASQAALREQLDRYLDSGDISSYRPLWIINAIAVTGSERAMLALAEREDVAAVKPDQIVDSLRPAEENADLLRALLEEPVDARERQMPWGINQVRAPHAWHALGLDGTGITIGIMDSGVDFEHPDLIDNYRGNLGNGSFEHVGNWYYTSQPGNMVPTDTIGHGTHVAGTAVGRNGIGVAPGAQWIAVNIAGEGGGIYDSDAHAGFQWLLAPNNDPALAPDIINGSWSGHGGYTAFVEDIAILQSAGIIPVFAAGNAGPFTGTVGFPASYTNTLAVGASDDIDDIAWFSGLGPSPLNDDVKPWLLAPGTLVLSAQPKGNYALYNGTSMAAPHVSGAIALLLSGQPQLEESGVLQRLAETAVPLSDTHPNLFSGYGRLDAYAAAKDAVVTGQLAGVVRGDGDLLPHVTLTVTTPSGAALPFSTNEAGAFVIDLAPDNYGIQVARFGHARFAATNLTVTADQVRMLDIDLSLLPGGMVHGRVLDAGTLEPLAGAQLKVLNTPQVVTTDENGDYTVRLPAGSYKLQAGLAGHRLGAATVIVDEGTQPVRNFWLPTGPRTLLIDSGHWYYQAYGDIYEQSLSSLGFHHERLTVRNPLRDAPREHDLADYDVVIWSAPKDSPGILGTNRVVTSFLESGGNLFISGERIGMFDGQGADSQSWYYRALAASYQDKSTAFDTLSGIDHTMFAGIDITLNGGSSANNQTVPDRANPRWQSLTEPIFADANGDSVGLRAGRCEPFTAIYLGFGLEGVTEAADRNAILGRSYDHFAAPENPFGLRFLPDHVDDFAIAGQTMAYTITLQNLSETLTDTFSLSLAGSGWNSALLTPTLTLGPCQRAQTVVTVDVPAATEQESTHVTQLTAVSQTNPDVLDYMLIEHNVPGQVLFVDDDRWYDEQDHLTTALSAAGIAYDYWEIGWNFGEGRGSPSLGLLNQYDFVVWYTGYDWYAPILPAEAASLAGYLEAGGRLFLTSQDFLYYNGETTLARHYLGVQDFRQSITPTVVYAANHPGLGAGLASSMVLSRGRYHNEGDGLIPAASATPYFWHNSGMPAGVAHAANWRSIFWGISFEMLPDAKETAAMATIMGWLSDLGDSSFVVDQRIGGTAEPRTYTMTVRNAANDASNQVQLSNPLPPQLTIVPDSLTGGATYNPEDHTLSWSGTLAPGAAHEIRYTAFPAQILAAGTPVTNVLSLHYDRHDLTVTREAIFWIDSPDLSGSQLTAVSNRAQAADEITYQLVLRNSGAVAAREISTVVRLPADFSVQTATLSATQGTAWLNQHRLNWESELAPGAAVTVTVVTSRTAPSLVDELKLPATAVIQDGHSGYLLETHWLHLRPYRQYFPLAMQN